MLGNENGGRPPSERFITLKGMVGQDGEVRSSDLPTGWHKARLTAVDPETGTITVELQLTLHYRERGFLFKSGEEEF